MYKWTKEDLKRKIELYEKAMEEETDIYKKAQMACEIDFDKSGVFNEFNDINLRRESLKSRLFNAYNIHLIASRYASLAQDFRDAILHNDIKFFQALYFFEKHGRELERQNRGLQFSKDGVLDLSDVFYRGFDSELYEYFLRTFIYRKTHVNFSPKTQDGDYTTSGYCLYLCADRSNYLKLLESTGVEPVYVSVHEFGHATGFSFNPQARLFDNKTIEVSSFFPEFVAMDRNLAGVSPLLRAKKELELISILNDFASNIFLQSEILYIWAQHGYKTDFGFYLDCFKNNISYAAIKESFRGDVNEDLAYATSAYMVFYLLAQYRKDPEKALNVYKYYLGFSDKDDILHLFMNDNAKTEVFSEVEQRINGICDTTEEYRRKK